MKRDFLHRFIDNLDEGELRYCREALELNPQFEKNGMLELFTALVKIDSYDASSLKQKLRHKSVKKHLPVAKKRLYQILLEEVKRLRQQRLPATSPKKRLQEAEVLLEMGLLEEAAQILEKGLKHLEKHEDLHVEVALRDLLRKVYKQMAKKDLVLKRTQNEYRLVTATAKLHKLNRYVQMNERMYDYLRSYRVSDNTQVKNAIEELMKQPELANVKEADSLHAQILYHSIWHRYYSHGNELDKSIEMNKRVVQLMESDPERVASRPDTYQSELANLTGKLVLQKRMDEAETYLKRLEKIPIRSRRMEVQHFGNTEIQLQLFYMNQGKLKEVAERAPKIDQGLRKFKNELNTSSQLTLLYNLVVTYLLLGESGNAKRKIEQIRSYGKLPVRQDLQGLARLLRLIILSEEEDQSSFPHFLRNSKRYFVEKDRHYPLEKVIYEWTTHHNSTITAAERKTSCGILANSMSPFVKDGTIGAEEIQLWAEGKARSISGAEVFLERLG